MELWGTGNTVTRLLPSPGTVDGVRIYLHSLVSLPSSWHLCLHSSRPQDLVPGQPTQARP